MTLRSFGFPLTTATHVRFTALHNKCTGTTSYHGYLGVPAREDADPANNTDCRVENTTRFPKRITDVRAAEVRVFGQDSFVVPIAVVDGIFKDGFEG